MTRIFPTLVLVPLCAVAAADEGMWTLDNFPADAVAEKYDVSIDDRWLRNAQLATTRLESGCTGSFASANGLVLTNNHCTWSCIRNLSTAERNLSDEGFMARARDEELRCPGQQISVLVDFEDVTDKIASATQGMDEADANEARKAESTRLEAACEAAADGERHCEAVKLYNGGQYFIYEYQRYDDVRLVFAPELDIAAFGGDPDNFNFPRWCLDMAFLRAYEDGKPAKTPNYLRWRASGPDAGEPVFITGHPGSTDRLLTVAQLKFQRDVTLPLWLLRYSELRGRMMAWKNTSDAAARTVQQRILGYENAIKVRRNELKALQTDYMIERKAAGEQAMRDAVAADPKLAAAYGEAWDLIERSLAAHRNFYEEHLFIESSAGLSGELYYYAKTIVRGTAEREKPNDERIRAYTDAALPGLEQSLFAARPVDKDFEEVQLTFSLEKMREWLGPDSQWVHLILGKEAPDALAARLVAGSKLDDPAYRRKLWEGGVEAVAASDDPLVRLAARVDPGARDLRKRYEDEVEAPRVRGEQMIADARFRLYGTDTYPDATFTLRVTYGAVEGWQERGDTIEPFTRTARLFERATGQAPFRLPESWSRAREDLDPETPFNFVATTDITGGNSGSPMIAADGALIGLAFDGNIHSIAGDYWFDGSVNRTVGVNTAIMLEAMKTVYGAGHLVDELTFVD
ncbi:MAG: S46 family peptidase [Gammaproteobacteria bacterium]|nr:S46 family peptidase [Gammaproteobacteria bacterium]NNF48827.1 S46 family peptidase [Woeseiaceae bacterium]MBT8093811.1 S46 family peptidase [Gammaproteobacteria bacterium]MBT8105895.1 S46 family peptidase [Gammaproteobacteria bacterium]NNK25909.1 S46 family peptidase [Woeseiaceae bacterium]